jgi:hypothetical protein
MKRTNMNTGTASRKGLIKAIVEAVENGKDRTLIKIAAAAGISAEPIANGQFRLDDLAWHEDCHCRATTPSDCDCGITWE